jgi:hypothetical protein
MPNVPTAGVIFPSAVPSAPRASHCAGQPQLQRFSQTVNAPYRDLPDPNPAGLGKARLGSGQTLSSLLGGQCGSTGGVSQPQVEARSVEIWVARATTGRASSAR